MPPRSRVRPLALPLIAGLLACTEGTGPGSLGQLRVHPVFAQGEEPGTLGVSPSEIRIVLRRSDGAVVADTSLPYVTGDTTSWLIDLDNPPETVDIAADLGQGAATMYTGSGQVSLASGIGPSSTQHDLPVHYLRGPNATFTIDVSPDSAGLPSTGDTRQFSAVARDADGAALTGFSFTWASTQPGVATVSAAGLVTAVAPGRSEITATSGGVVGSAVVTIGPNPAPVSITVSPDSGALSAGGTLQFKAVARDAQGNVVPGVVPLWSSTVIDVATVSDSGVATAVSPGQTLIIARSGTLADSAKLVVFDNGTGGPGVATIVVTPPAATITGIGATQQFTATALDSHGAVVPGVTFQWASSNGAVASVNGAGLATAIATGGTTITATANGVTGSASLTVSSGAGPPVLIVVLPAAATITALGDTQQFTAVAFDAQGHIVPAAFTWSTSNPAIAAINAAGVAAGISTGSVTVVATAAGRTGSASLAVTQVVHSISVSPASATVVAGDSTPYTAVARDANGHVIPGTVFTWATANPSIATVSGNGVVSGVTSGSTIVQAYAGGSAGSATVSVVVVGSVEISGAAERHVKVGATIQFFAVVRDPAGNVLTGVQVTWSLSQPGIASIDAVTGLATGLSPGLTLVRATIAGLFDEVELFVRQ